MPQMTVAEALQLLDKINKSTTWGGLNAQQINDLVTFEKRDWERARRTFNAWVRNWRRFPTWGIYLGLAIGIILSVLVPGGWRWLFGIVSSIFLFSLGYRDGHTSGWFNGYEMGHRDSTFGLLGVNEEDAEKMYERAIRMEVEGRAASALKERGSKRHG